MKLIELHNPLELIQAQYTNRFTQDQDGAITGINLSSQRLDDDRIKEILSDDLSRLEVLNLSGNTFEDLIVPELPKLTHLLLDENTNLRHVEFSAALPCLQVLDINECALESFHLLAGFWGLIKLDLSRNKSLNSVELKGKLPNLEVLDLSENRLTEFDAPKGLKALRFLYLNQNNIASINFPEPLPGLETLHLRNNELTEIENDFLDAFPQAGKLALYLANNPLPEQILGFLENQSSKSCIEFLIGYFEDMGMGEAIDNECKVLVVGNGAVGKTCMVNRLVYDTFDEAESSTHAISLEQFPKDRKEFPRFKWLLNIWDFGGQDIYHATHRLFMRSGAVYLILWDRETENKLVDRREEDGEEREYEIFGLSYWLSYGKHLGDGSPALVIQTKKEKHGIKDIPEIREAFADQFQYFNIHQIDSKAGEEDNGFEELRLYLNRAVGKIKTDKETIPESWAQVRQSLREKQKSGEKRMGLEAYKLLSKGIKHTDRMEILENWLVKTGVVFYRKGLFEDQIILDQEWAIEAIYALLDREQHYYKLEKKKGRFTGKELNNYWKQYLPAERELFISFMLSCELCFEDSKKKQEHSHIPFEERTFVAPQLLPDEKPDSVEEFWQSVYPLHLIYSHEFLHYGVIQSFIVRTQTLAEQGDIWKQGLVLKEGTQRALVEVRKLEDRKRQIYVRVTKGSKQLLDKIRNLLEELQDEKGEESVSADGNSFVLLKDLLTHPTSEPRIRCLDKQYQNYTDFAPFLGKDVNTTFGKSDDAPKAENKPMIKTIKIFLASAEELEEDRDQFRQFISEQNDRLHKKGIYLEIIQWEYFFDAMSPTSLQGEYNKEIKECEMGLCLFATKAGKYTQSEVETAWNHFKETGRPFIFTYFKNVSVNMEELNMDNLKSLTDFKQKLRALGHFPTRYSNIDNLKVQFKRQLEIYLEEWLPKSSEMEGDSKTIIQQAEKIYNIGKIDDASFS